MKEFKISIKNRTAVLALGAESAGNFSVFQNGNIYFSEDFGDLLNEQNFSKFKIEVLRFLKDKKIKPGIILSDLHPNFHTTILAKELSKKYKAEHIPVQHHLAHIFSAIGDEFIHNTSFMIPDTFFGVACDGTGFGFDEKIWGGEIFTITKIQNTKHKQISNSKIQITRIGHLENQILLGGEMAIMEPARILISILSKFLSSSRVIPSLTRNPDSRFRENDHIYKYVKNFYTRNEFEVLWNQLQQNFNCLETSSTARILDAVSVLLGFSNNERLSKHGPVELLEKNSKKPYSIKPVVEFNKSEEMWILKTTPLFEYLIKNLHKDKHRLAATAQAYIANGLLEIRNEFIHNTSYKIRDTYFAGGMANNKIISSTLESQGIYTNKKIPRGDAGISFGQIFYHYLRF